VLLFDVSDMAAPTPAAHSTQDSSFLRWIMDAGYADGDGDAFGFKGPAFFDPNFLSPLPPAPMLQLQHHREEVFSLPQLPQQLPVPLEGDLEPQAVVDELLEIITSSSSWFGTLISKTSYN
jgi:hypothetical protein